MSLKHQIRDMVKEGFTNQAISETLGVSISTIQHVVRTYGLQGARKGFTPGARVRLHALRDRDSLAEMKEEGLSVRQIADRLQCAPYTVRQAYREAEIEPPGSR